VKILIADDSKAIRRGIGQLLHKDLGATSVGEAASGPEAIEKLRAESWDVVVLDISMPGGNGYGLLEWRKAERVRVAVVMQSSDVGRSTVKRCLDLGATAFVAKERLSDELVPAVLTVARGEMYLCRVVIAAIGLLQIPRLADFAVTGRSRLNRLVARRLRENAHTTLSRSQNLLANSYSIFQASRDLREQFTAARRVG
jgi:DNA-binding NarL/FixJ family response regulator